jgi:preprotein translocase subunit SecG
MAKVLAGSGQPLTLTEIVLQYAILEGLVNALSRTTAILSTRVEMLYSSQYELSHALQRAYASHSFFFLVLGLALALIILLFSLRSQREKPPLAANATPVLGHLALFMKDPAKLASTIMYGTNAINS